MSRPSYPDYRLPCGYRDFLDAADLPYEALVIVANNAFCKGLDIGRSRIAAIYTCAALTEPSATRTAPTTRCIGTRPGRQSAGWTLGEPWINRKRWEPGRCSPPALPSCWRS